MQIYWILSFKILCKFHQFFYCKNLYENFSKFHQILYAHFSKFLCKFHQFFSLKSCANFNKSCLLKFLCKFHKTLSNFYTNIIKFHQFFFLNFHQKLKNLIKMTNLLCETQCRNTKRIKNCHHNQHIQVWKA